MQFKCKEILILLRPRQYIKNLFIFLPIFFSQKINDFQLLNNVFLAFFAFSFTVSAVYILNDYKDIEADRHHPQKKHRPLASGTIGRSLATVIMAILLVLGISLMVFTSIKAASILIAYVIMNIAYSFYLKHIAIIDVTIISIGFVLRLFIGSAATDISLSKWIVIMTFLLALFLALAKRRDDMMIFQDSGKKMRNVIDGYSLQFLDITMAIMAAVVVVSYTIYTTSSEVVERFNCEYLYLTALFVVVGIMRYLQITFVLKSSGSPTEIVLQDRFMQLTLMGWIITFAWILY